MGSTHSRQTNAGRPRQRNKNCWPFAINEENNPGSSTCEKSTSFINDEKCKSAKIAAATAAAGDCSISPNKTEGRNRPPSLALNEPSTSLLPSLSPTSSTTSSDSTAFYYTTNEMLLQIIRCFPFPSPKSSPLPSPSSTHRNLERALSMNSEIKEKQYKKSNRSKSISEAKKTKCLAGMSSNNSPQSKTPSSENKTGDSGSGVVEKLAMV
ncbi:unnamed protein product [Dracunculus medinensis]|uniref:Uncharacterized protein n=1 Tax=Dracunculus medinensis TaxID=318479 RepID=A0A0N4UB36_DRAME|nr:unnamed protein product [Dracunculus medinensis]